MTANNWPAILEVQGQKIDAQVIEHKYRALAKQRHPDAGGSNEAMTALNLAKDAALRWVADQQHRAAQAGAAKVAAAQAETIFRQVFNQQMNAQMNAAANQSQWGRMAQGLGGLGNMAGAGANAAANGSEERLHKSAKEEKRRTKWERVRDILRGKA